MGRTPATLTIRQAATADNDQQAKLAAAERRLDDHINSVNSRFDNQTTMLNQILSSLQRISERLQKIEVENIGTVLTLQNQVKDAIEKATAGQKSTDDLEKKVDALKGEIPEKLRNRLEKIEEVLPSILFQNRIMIFIAGAIAMALIGLLWAIFTGQATVTFSK